MSSIALLKLSALVCTFMQRATSRLLKFYCQTRMKQGCQGRCTNVWFAFSRRCFTVGSCFKITLMTRVLVISHHCGNHTSVRAAGSTSSLFRMMSYALPYSHLGLWLDWSSPTCDSPQSTHICARDITHLCMWHHMILHVTSHACDGWSEQLQLMKDSNVYNSLQAKISVCAQF